MSLTKLYKRLFADTPDSYVEGRRRFIKCAAGLAALSVIPASGTFKLLDVAERNQLISEIESGLIEGKTFLIDRTICIKNMINLTIRNCRFIASDNFIGNSLLEIDNNNAAVFVINCAFENRDPRWVFNHKLNENDEQGHVIRVI